MKRTIRLLAISLLLVAVFSLAPVNSALAQEEQTDFTSQNAELETGQTNIEANPIYVRLVEIINFLSIGVGIVITISVVYAGILYTTSRGDPSQTAKAAQRLLQAGIAGFLYLFGWALLNWLIPGGVLNPAMIEVLS